MIVNGLRPGKRGSRLPWRLRPAIGHGTFFDVRLATVSQPLRCSWIRRHFWRTDGVPAGSRNL